MNLTRTTTALFAAITMFVLSVSAVQAGDAKGDWLRPDNGSIITVFKCGAGLGMKIKKAETSSIAHRKYVGKVIGCSLKADGKNKWSGLVLSTDDDRFYNVSMVLANNGKLKLEGCEMHARLCHGENWKRVK